MTSAGLGLVLRVQETPEVSAFWAGFLLRTPGAQRRERRGRAELAQGDFSDHPGGSISGSGSGLERETDIVREREHRGDECGPLTMWEAVLSIS